jgi:hypothetical protein
MGEALMLDQCQLANAPVGLTQLHAKPVGQPHQPLARPIEKLCVGRRASIRTILPTNAKISFQY